LLQNIWGFSSVKSKLTTQGKNLSHCNSPESKTVIIQGAAHKYSPTSPTEVISSSREIQLFAAILQAGEYTFHCSHFI